MTLPKVDKQASLQEQVAQMQSQIYQLKEQIEWLLSVMGAETKKEIETATTGLADFVQSSVIQNGEFKSVINQTAAKINTRIDGLEGNVSTLEQTSTRLETRVQDAEGDATQALQTATQLSQRVVLKGQVVAEINLDTSGASINADKINLKGYTTVNGNFHIDENGDMFIETDRIKVLAGGSLNASGISGAEGLIVARVDAGGNIISSQMMWYADDGLVDSTGAYVLQHIPSSRGWYGFSPGATSLGQGDTYLSLYGYNTRPTYNGSQLALLSDVSGGGYNYGFSEHIDDSSWDLIAPWVTSDKPYYFRTDAGTGDSTTVPTIAMVKAMINYAVGSKKFT